MSNINLGGGYSSSPQASQHWTLRDRLRNLTTALSGGASLDLRFINQYFYKADQGGDPNQYAALELLDATCTRGSKGWYPEWDFTNGGVCGRLTEYANNAIRYGSQGLLEEASSTNRLEDPRFERSEIGATGNSAIPDGAALYLNPEVVGKGYENGWPYLDLRWNGTPPTAPRLDFEANIPWVSGEAGAFSVGMRIVGGDTTNVDALRTEFLLRTSAGSYIGSEGRTYHDVDTTHRRFYSAATITHASLDYVQPSFAIDWTSGAIDITIRFYLPQLEQASAPSSPILPVIGTPAATTRTTETVTGLTTVSRSSRKSNAGEWDFASGGTVGAFREYLPDVPAVTGKGLLVEEGTTNQIRNPRGEGASGATPPTHWEGGFNNTTASYSIATENGWPAVDVALSGGTDNDSEFLFLEDVATISAVQGDVVTISVCARIVSGDLTGITRFDLQFNEHSGGGASLTNSTVGADGSEVLTDLDGTWRRFFFTYTVQDASCASVRPTLRQRNASSNASSIALTLRLGVPQVEKKSYPTSPILPPKGDPGAATRAADDIEVANGSWVANSDGPFSLYAEVAAVRRAPENSNRNNIVALSNDTFSNIANLHFIGSPHQLRTRTQSGGASDSTPSTSPLSGIASPSGTIRLAAGWDTDNFAYSASGGTQDTDTSVTLPVGMDRLQIGADPAGRRLNGYIKQLRYFPRRLSNAELEALVGN